MWIFEMHDYKKIDYKKIVIHVIAKQLLSIPFLFLCSMWFFHNLLFYLLKIQFIKPKITTF
jgi:hypothetical protein